MAKFTFTTLVDPSDIISTKFTDAFTDTDIGKPVKLDTSDSDCYTLCADGDSIEGFIASIEPGTVDGKVFGTVQVGGRVRVESDGSDITIGEDVAAAAPAAAGTAETNGLGKVSAHVAVGTEQVRWRAISAATAAGDGTIGDADTTVIIERL